MAKSVAEELTRRVSLAARSGRALWLRIHAPFCEAGRRWRREVLDAPEARVAAAAFELFDIDCEESPDIDDAAQTLAQSQGLAGGWPLNLFLGAEGRPLFVAGALDAPSLASLLRQLAVALKLDGPALQAQARLSYESACAADPLQLSTLGRPLRGDGRALLERFFVPALQSLDLKTGWVGEGLVSQRPAVYRALLASVEYRAAAATALQALATSALADVIGGGFFRAAEAPEGSVTHVATEKLLVENAELLEAFTEAWLLTRSPFSAQAASETLACLVNDFASGGGFASWIGADASGYEIAATDLIEALPGPQRQAAQIFFGISSRAALPRLPSSIDEVAGQTGLDAVDAQHLLFDARKKLKAWRDLRRRRPLEKGPRRARGEAVAARAILRAVEAFEAGAIDSGAASTAAEKCLALLKAPPRDFAGPRDFWESLRAQRAAAAFLERRNDERAAAYRARAAEIFERRHECGEVATWTPFLGRRLGLRDHLGSSAAASRLMAMLDLGRRDEEFESALAQALEAARGLGLHAASTYLTLSRQVSDMAGAQATQGVFEGLRKVKDEARSDPSRPLEP